MLRISNKICYIYTLYALSCGAGFAMQVTDFIPAVNNRFASGFPSAPVNNTDPAFIGAVYDWSAVGWSSGNNRAGYLLLSPRHYLLARHFPSNGDIRVFGNDGIVHSMSLMKVEDTTFGVLFEGQPYGDLSLGTLSTVVPTSAQIARYGVLDLNPSSTTNSEPVYDNKAMLLYGHWGFPTNTGSTRVAAATSLVALSESTYLLLTARNDVQLEGNDSGSPAFFPWQNPDGVPELTIVGNNAGESPTYNVLNFAGTREVMSALSGFMADDGHALRIVGNPARRWVGGNGLLAQRDDLFKTGNWYFSGSPGDQFVFFNASATTWRAIDVNAAGSLRGLYFKSTAASSDGFTFSGTNSLTIGRGGITNYDFDPQTFTSPLILGAHQHWTAGPGGIIATDLNTNGNLLEIRSQGNSIIHGAISGSGGIALEKGKLTLNGTSSYSGKTWIHDGNLTVNSDISSSQRIITGVTAVLSGSGIVPIIEGSGSISPGLGKGILTSSSLVTSSGMDFHFEFTQPGSPAYGQAGASGNDVLRLTAATPFSQSLLPSNVVHIYLDLPPPDSNVVLRGGFFTDSLTATPQIFGATYQYYLADDNGSISHNGKSYSAFTGVASVALVPETAVFSNGTVNGSVMEITFSPDPSTYAGWAVGNFPESVPPELRLPDADANQDGIPNLIAYALRLDPMSEIHQELPQIVVTENSVSFQFRRNKIASDLTLIVQTTTTMDDWDTAPESQAIISDPDTDVDFEVLEIQSTITPETPRRFFRLKAALK